MPDLLDRLHRMSFRAVSLLPVTAHGRVLRRFFPWTHRVPDPWRYESEPYELARHETTVRHIPVRAYRRVLDVGCGEGAFTRRLAGALPGARCWGVDVSDRAIVRAAARGGTAGFAALDVLTETPEGVFDLVICAETLYYAGRGRRLRLLLSRLRSFMAPGGVLVLVHEWPEARRLYRYLDGDPSLRKVSEHPYDDPSRPYAVTVYEHVGSPVPEPAPGPGPEPAPGPGPGPAPAGRKPRRAGRVRSPGPRKGTRIARTVLVSAVLAAGTAAACRPAADELPLPATFTARALQDAYDRHAWHGRRFLALSRAGDGQAIEVVGDLARARRVIVYVPGSGQSLAAFDDSPESPGRAAHALHDEAAALGPGTAVIGWLGYDTPSLAHPEILTVWPADRGARRLRSLIDRLPRHLRISLVCHSYGSVVCARAVAGASPVRDLIVMGSPGLGVGKASDLRTPARIWAMLGRNDDVLRAGLLIGPFGFGTDPVRAGFGARVVDGGDTRHHGYLRPGSRTLTEITHIAVTGTRRAA